VEPNVPLALTPPLMMISWNVHVFDTETELEVLTLPCGNTFQGSVPVLMFVALVKYDEVNPFR